MNTKKLYFEDYLSLLGEGRGNKKYDYFGGIFHVIGGGGCPPYI